MTYETHRHTINIDDIYRQIKIQTYIPTHNISRIFSHEQKLYNFLAGRKSTMQICYIECHSLEVIWGKIQIYNRNIYYYFAGNSVE